MAKIIPYFEFDQDAAITCTSCGAVGGSADWLEPYDELFDITCGKCGLMLYIVSYPTIEQIRAYAAAGHEKAIAMLPEARKREEFLEKLKREQLRSADELPDVDGERLEFTWDFLEADGERYTLILVDDREIWREPAVYDGYHRFERMRELLAERYGERFAGLTYTERSMLWLFD
jgi:transcription elongation factor Elf1